MNTKLEEVRAKVIEAVPEILNRTLQYGSVYCYPITLADVLRAMNEQNRKEDATGIPRLGILTNGHFYNQMDERSVWTEDGMTPIVWNLALPLDEQELEVITFLHKILV